MIQALIGPVTGLLDKFVEDKDQKNALAHEIAKQKRNTGQYLLLDGVHLQDGSLRSRLHTTFALCPLFFSQQRLLVSRFLSYLNLIWKP